MGANGCIYVNGTAATTGDFIAIHPEDSVLGAITSIMDGSADLISDGTTFSQGQVIYVPATSVTLASGAAILYRKNAVSWHRAS